METRPKIIMSSLDAERLESLLESLPEAASPARGARGELRRTEVVGPKDVPPTVVTMNSTVRFRVGPEEDFQLTLVYPRDADGSASRISVLAPVGSALLGLSQGDEMEWPKPGGGTVKVRIEEVTYQPERAGEYHR